MRKNSTLFYYVNNFQADLIKCEDIFSDIDNRQNLTVKSSKDYIPSERIVQNILEFARVYEILETRSTGCTELILN